MKPWDKFKSLFFKKVLFKGCIAVCGIYYITPIVGAAFMKMASPERMLTISPSVYPFPADLVDYFKPLMDENNYKINFHVYNKPNVSAFMHNLHDGSFTVFLPKNTVEQLEDFKIYSTHPSTSVTGSDLNQNDDDSLHKGSKIIGSYQVLSPAEIIYLVDYMCATLNSNKFAKDAFIRIGALVSTVALFRRMSISKSWHSYRYLSFIVVLLFYRMIMNFNDAWFVYNFLSDSEKKHPERIYFGNYYYTNMILRCKYNRIPPCKSPLLFYCIHRRFYRRLAANRETLANF